MDNGYPEAMIVSNREPVYYVIARTCATAAEAAEALRRVSDDPSLSLRSPPALHPAKITSLSFSSLLLLC